MRTCQVGILAAALCAASCAAQLRPCAANCISQLPAAFQPDPAIAAVVVRLEPTTEWTDTAIVVRKGDLLLVTAEGEVTWQASHRTAGPDGEGGSPGWSVGRGGLYGRVGEKGSVFDLGSRTGLFHDQHPRPPHRLYPPPPIAMPRDGTLFLGFKNFTPGTNTGGFDVTIRRAVPAAQMALKSR